MVEFKAVINDNDGRAHQVTVEGHHANSLIGKRVGEVVDGIFVGLPGYKLKITGGSDRDGFPMRSDIPGPKRRKVLLSGGVGFHPREGGQRRRKTIRGNTVSPDTSQLNMTIDQAGSKSIDDLLSEEEK
ncbi:MAG: 30S ribosomal protein S6e [Methanomassiliicoccales archaeon]